MKQLLIVNSAKALNYNLDNGTGGHSSDYVVTDLSKLDAGAITFFFFFFEYALAAPATKNFGIALGKQNGNFIIPEVDIDTLFVTKILPKLGTAFKRKFTFPQPAKKGDEFTIIFTKKGALPNERANYSCSIAASSTTAATEATRMKKEIENKLGDHFTVTVSTADITIVGKTIGEQWEATMADNLSGVSFAGSTDFVNAEPTIGDKAYVQKLAAFCAAGKGYNYTDGDGRDLYKDYPETVENLTPNTSGQGGASTAGYAIFDLHFATKRDAGKQTDERIWQDVFIAVPITMNSGGFAAISTILPEGKYSVNVANAAAKAVADAEIVAKVKDTALNE